MAEPQSLKLPADVGSELVFRSGVYLASQQFMRNYAALVGFVILFLFCLENRLFLRILLYLHHYNF